MNRGFKNHKLSLTKNSHDYNVLNEIWGKIKRSGLINSDRRHSYLEQTFYLSL